MTNGININGDGTGVSINGVRCGVVSDLACAMASTGLRRTDDTITGDEQHIAGVAARLLLEMRRKGYSPQDTRKAFMQKIVDEANSCRVAQAVEQVAVNDLAEGSSPSSAATDRSKTCADTEKLSSGSEIPGVTARNDSAAESDVFGERQET